MKIDHRILKAVSSLGINYLDITNLLEMSEKVPLAAWGVHKKTGESKIFLNPKIAEFPSEQIKLLIRHEVLHYAGYHELGTVGLKNKDLSNFTLDVAINKILALAYRKEMDELCKKIYPKGSEKTPVALAQPQLSEKDIDSEWEPGNMGPISGSSSNKIAVMHNEIWNSSAIPSPLSLYFRLLNEKFDPRQNPFRNPPPDSGQGEGSGQKGEGLGTSGKGSGQRKRKGKPSQGKSLGKPSSDDEPDENEKPNGEPNAKPGDGTGGISFHEVPKGLENENKDLLEQLGKQIDSMKGDVAKDSNAQISSGGFSAKANSFFQKAIAKVKGNLDIRGVTRFIDQLNLKKEMANVLDPLIKEASSTSRRQLYPLHLSRLGTVYAACGISDVLPFFWNRTPENQKLSVSVYVDTSPSMNDCIDKEIQLIDKLKDSFPSKIFAFSGDVKEASIKEFAKGTYYRGPSTCFDAVVKHFLEQKEEFALVFTDGESRVRLDWQAKFRKSRKRLFAIYFNKDRDYFGNIGSDLDEIAEKSTTLHAGGK